VPTPSSPRVRGVFLVQLGATAKPSDIDAWLGRFRTSLATADRTAIIRSAVVGAKGGLVLSIDANVANAAALDAVISRTRTAMGATTPAITTI
jgi:hypothetical protein